MGKQTHQTLQRSLTERRKSCFRTRKKSKNTRTRLQRQAMRRRRRRPFENSTPKFLRRRGSRSLSYAKNRSASKKRRKIKFDLAFSVASIVVLNFSEKQSTWNGHTWRTVEA